MKNSQRFLAFAIIVTISFLFTSNIFAANPKYKLSGIKDTIIGPGDGGAQDEGGVRLNGLNTSIIESVVSDNGYVELININASANSSIVEITDVNNRRVYKTIVPANVKHRANISTLSEGSYTLKFLDSNNRILKTYLLKVIY